MRKWKIQTDFNRDCNRLNINYRTSSLHRIGFFLYRCYRNWKRARRPINSILLDLFHIYFCLADLLYSNYNVCIYKEFNTDSEMELNYKLEIIKIIYIYIVKFNIKYDNYLELFLFTIFICYYFSTESTIKLFKKILNL